MKEIIFVVHTYDKKSLGGVLKAVSDLSKALSYKNKVTIVSLGKVQDLCFSLNDNISLVELDHRFYDPRQLRGVLKVWWFVSNFYGLWIYLNNLKSSSSVISSSPALTLLCSLLSFKFKNVDFIGCDHTSFSYQLPLGLQKIRLKLLRRLQYYISLTPADHKYFLENKVNSKLIPNMINRHAKLINKGKDIIFIGRFSSEKNPLDVIETFHASGLYKKGSKLRMYGYGELKGEMENLIRSLAIEKYVFLISNETNKEVMLDEALCLVLMSSIEGFGLVLLEAMSFGIPCVSYDSDHGPRYIIQDGKNGFLVEVGNKEMLSTLLIKIFEDVKMFDKNIIRESISNYYTTEVISKWNIILE